MAVEVADWTVDCLQETLNENVDPHRWSEEVCALPRFRATICKSVDAYVRKDSGTISLNIEGAVLREAALWTGANLQWIDGSQYVLTKVGGDKTYLYKVLREGVWSLAEDPAAVMIRTRKSRQRAVKDASEDAKKEEEQGMRSQRAELVRGMPVAPEGAHVGATILGSVSVSGPESALHRRDPP